MLKPTPFHERTGPLCQGHSWANWAGFLAATTYEPDHIHEYNAVRTGSGLFDVSPLFKYDIRGRDALAAVNRVAVRDLSKSRVGQVFYSVWCDDKGMVIDDGTVSQLGEDHFRITAAIPTLAWLQDTAIGLEVTIEDVSEQFAAVALQGPTSRDLLQNLTDVDLGGLRFFRCTDGKVAGAPALISRTGYTGDLGYEVFVGPDDAVGLWDAMMEAGGDYQMLPAGLATLDLVRIEGGLLGIDADFTSALQTMFPIQKLSVYDLGLGWMINPNKGFFIGRDALRREKASGSRYDTVGLELDITVMEKAYAEYGMPLHLPYTSWNSAVPIFRDEPQEHHIGRGTSGMWSPVLKKYIVMARVKPEYAKLGNLIWIEDVIESHAYSVPARVVKMPFYDPPWKKA
jgi:aminomethyltransferase